MSKKIFILAIVNSFIFSNLYSETIKLSSSQIKSDYIEIQRLKPTKNIIVIERKDFIDKGYKNISEILDDIPSINVGKSGWGSIDIRGQGEGDAAKNLQVLLDGAPITNLINHPLQNNYDLIPVENIERIEIVPSGGSILYGSGTVGGVINITTNLKRLDRPVKTLSIKTASNMKEVGFSYGNKINENLSAQISYTNSKKDLYFVDTYRNTEYFTAGLNYKINNSSSASLRYSNLSENGQFIRTISAEKLKNIGKDYRPEKIKKTIGLDENKHKIEKEISGYADAKRNLNSFNFSYNKSFSSATYNLDLFYNKGNFNNGNLDLEMDHTTKGIKNKFLFNYGSGNFEGSNILFGLDYYKQSANIAYNDYKLISFKKKTYREQPLSFKYDKKTLAFYVSNNLKYNDFTFTQGLRKDYTYWGFDKVASLNAGSGVSKRDNINYEFAVSYDYRDTGKIYARYERSFTSPDGMEITDDFSKGTINPTKAEDTIYDIYEIGLRDKIGFSTVVLTAFLNNTDNEMSRNLILDKKLGLRRESINILKTKRRGFEIGLSQKFGKLTLEENYTYLKGKRSYNSKAKEYSSANIDWSEAGLKKVPKHSLTLKSNYDFNENWSANVRYNYSGKYSNYLDESEFNLKEEEKFIKSHSTVDLGINYKNEKGLALSAGINNLLNEKYFEYVGDKKYTVIPAEERTYYIGLKYTF